MISGLYYFNRRVTLSIFLLCLFKNISSLIDTINNGYCRSSLTDTIDTVKKIDIVNKSFLASFVILL